MKKLGIVALAIFGYMTWHYLYSPTPKVISLHIGQSFHEVVNSSSFKVMDASTIPDESTDGSGATWITQPAVIVHFNDPQYEFTLPPTTFVAIDYRNYRVSTIATTPMLKKLPFDEAFVIAESLQRQFQAKGWQPENGTGWLDFGEKEVLHKNLRQWVTTYRNHVELVAPRKYSIIFRFYCSERCDSRIGLDRYLVDVGIGQDYSYSIEKRKHRNENRP